MSEVFGKLSKVPLNLSKDFEKLSEVCVQLSEPKF